MRVVSIELVASWSGLAWSTAEAAGPTLARRGVHYAAPSTTRYEQATTLGKASQPEVTNNFLSVQRLHARQNTITVAPQPAVIVMDDKTLASFPPYLCGFVGGDPDMPLTCTYRATCAGFSTNLCCARSGSCAIPPSSFTACQDVDITNSADPYWASTSFTLSNKLHCDLAQGVQCQTKALMSLSAFGCLSIADQSPSWQTVYPPDQFLSYFAGHTIEWDIFWSLVAIRAESSTSAGTPSNATTSGIPTNAIGYLAEFKAPVPQCAENITELCPNLYRLIQTCHNSSTNASCYCDAFTRDSCSGFCLQNNQPNEFLRYIVPTCQELLGQMPNSSFGLSNRTTSMNWTSSWPGYTNLSDKAYIQLFPWTWDVQLNSTELANGTAVEADEKLEQCPTVKSALVSFAIVNVVVFVASTITANRYVTYWLTCKFFGGPEGGKWWPASALLSVAINLLGNLVNALLIKGTVGYHHVPLWPLVLLWCTRPRLAWLVVLLVRLTRSFGLNETIYLDSAVAALMAEVILQGTAAVYMGLSVNHARANKFYLLGHVKYTPHGTDALIMYSGALIWTISIGLAFLSGVWTFTPVGGIVQEASITAKRFLESWSSFVWRHLLRWCVYVGVYLWAGIRGMTILLFMLTYWYIYYPIKLYMWKNKWRFCGNPPRGRNIDLEQWFQARVPDKYKTIPTRRSRFASNHTVGDDRPNEVLHRSTSPTAQWLAVAGIILISHPHYSRTFAKQVTHPKPPSSRAKRRKRVQQYLRDMKMDPVILPWKEQQRLDVEQYIKDMGLRAELLDELSTLVWFLLFPWVGQWIFWIGFVRMAKDLYCPPQIWDLTTVWSVCSVVAIWCGAAL